MTVRELQDVQPGAVVISESQRMYLVTAARTSFGWVRVVLLSHGSEAYKIYALKPGTKVCVFRPHLTGL